VEGQATAREDRGYKTTIAIVVVNSTAVTIARWWNSGAESPPHAIQKSSVPRLKFRFNQTRTPVSIMLKKLFRSAIGI
jgi:hypothetical protein